MAISFRSLPPPPPGKRSDILEKCSLFTRPRDLEAAGLYTYFGVFTGYEGCDPGEIWLGNRRVLMFGATDYLGIVTHPKLIDAGTAAVRRYGTGCSGPRLLNGTLDLHVKLEAELAAFVRKEAAIIFGTGFQANYALSALVERGDVMICDHNLHASLIEGAMRSTGRMMRFRHNDLVHLERCLQNCSSDDRVLIVSEGVFSMEGDLADMPGLVAKAKPYGARIYVSETDGLGVLGPTGAGASDQMGVLDEVDLVMGTFSKALASQGGFIAGPHNVINYLKHTARPFVFSASLPPAAVATAGAALEVIKEEPERRQRVLDIANRLRRELRSRGFTVLDGITPIVPVVVPYEDVLCRLCIALLDDGIYVNPLLRPAASQNLLRISCSATHTYSQVDRLVRKLMRLSKSLDCGLTDGIGQLQPIEALDPSEPYGRGASRP